MKNPPLRYFGSKWSLAPWLESHFPEHRTYVDVFGGSANMLLRKKKSRIEVYNDTYDAVVNFLSVMRDDCEELQRRLALTPYSRSEFVRCQAGHMNHEDRIERARMFFVQANQGIQGGGTRFQTGFRTSVTQNSNPQNGFIKSVDALHVHSSRMRGVVIENKDFEYIFGYYGGFSDTFLFVDPPYHLSTRTGSNRYVNEFAESDHVRLLEACLATKAKVMVCGYANELYDNMLSSWEQATKLSLTSGNKDGVKSARTEKIWMNYKSQNTLF